MGKRTKLREAQKFACEQALATRLHQHGRRSAPAFIDSWDGFPLEYMEKIEAYRAFALRPPEAWRCKLRVRSPELRFLELVKFTFARFTVPRHLEKAWLEPLDFVIGVRPPAPDFKHWYIAVAQGGSVYREDAYIWLSRAETHHFLKAPADVKSAQHALWYAIARAQGSEPAAQRIARTKLVDLPLSGFWKDVARYFARHETSILEMNDLVDFFEAERGADCAFSLSGRTLAALRRRMLSWHDWLRNGATVGRERWQGARLPNTSYEIDGVIWRFKQIKNGQRLFEEGERMHHCVSTYQAACAGGVLSIWSLTCEREGRLRRCLTLEVSAEGLVVQARGFANRQASTEEFALIKRWAAEHGLTCINWLRVDEQANRAA
jgi:PcfJ-like protein